MQQWVVVTGATGGVGQALIDCLVRQSDWQILALGRNASRLALLQQRYPDRLQVVSLDFAQDATCTPLLVSLVGKKIVALVHNAAQIEPLTPLLQLPLDQFEQQWRVNVMAPLALTQCCLPYFEAKARVLLLSSGAAHRSAAGMRPYSVTKAALYNAYQGLRTELMSTDILCASAKPGVIDTPMQQAIRQAAAFGEQDLQPYVQYEASGLLIAPELVGLWLAWLLKDVSDADYVQPVEWDIYEKKWQPKWLPEGVVLPER